MRRRFVRKPTSGHTRIHFCRSSIYVCTYTYIYIYQYIYIYVHEHFFIYIYIYIYIYVYIYIYIFIYVYIYLYIYVCVRVYGCVCACSALALHMEGVRRHTSQSSQTTSSRMMQASKWSGFNFVLHRHSASATLHRGTCSLNHGRRCFGSRVSGLGFGLRNSRFRSRDSGFGIRGRDFGIRDSGFAFRGLRFGFRERAARNSGSGSVPQGRRCSEQPRPSQSASFPPDPAPSPLYAPDLGLRISDFGFLVPGSGFRV